MRSPIQVRNYEFLSGIAVRLVTPRKDILAHFDGEYGRMAVTNDCDAQIAVHVDADHVDVSGDERAQVFSPRGRHKTITWKITASAPLDDPTTVVFEGSGTMAISFLQTFYLEPLLRLKFLQAGYALVHGCGIAEGNEAVLFVGESGVGKTSLALHHAMSGGLVQGDNYVILGPDGATYPFYRRLRIYSDLAQANPRAYQRLPLGERLQLQRNGLIKRLSLGFADMPRRLDIRQFASGCKGAPAARLRALFLLTAHKGADLTAPKPLGVEQAIDRILQVSASEASRLRDIFGSTPAPHVRERLAHFDELERTLLRRALSDITIAEILVPRVADLDALGRNIRSLAGVDPEHAPVQP